MLCLRVCGGYTYRLTRRHSTAFLIAIIIVFLVTILHLYKQNHYDRLLHEHYLVGDFDYRPGSFLKGQQPNENISYCQYNYGLPYNFKASSFNIHSSLEIGDKSPYKVVYNAIKGTAYQNASSSNVVTYVTHATPEFIYHIVEIAKSWDGPISLAVYVPDYDLDVTFQIVDQLCHCYPNMAKVSLHLFYPVKYPPRMVREPFVQTTVLQLPPASNITYEELDNHKRQSFRNLTNATRAEYIQKAIKKKIQSMMVKLHHRRAKAPYLTFPDCSGLSSFDIATYRRENNIVYPVNVGRNAARYAAKTDYFIVSDIEMVPSDGLATKFIEMLKKITGDGHKEFKGIIPKTVFVVPLFEVERGEQIPRDKDTLRALVEDNRAMYFHQKICVHCQRFPGLQRWLSKPAPDGVEPMLITRREYPYHRWEPIYFGTQKEPWFSEMLSWEGQQDKMTQVLELCLRGYDFAIIDGGFLVNFPDNFVMEKPKYNTTWYRTTVFDNLDVYAKIISDFYDVYAEHVYNIHGSDRCYLAYGFDGRPVEIYDIFNDWEANQTMMLELCLQGYRMVILDGAFLCHAARAPQDRSRYRIAEIANNKQYELIIERLKTEYKPKPQCKVDFGFKVS